MTEYPNEQYLASAEWLHTHLGEADVRVLDVRFDIRVNAKGQLEEVAGRDEYLAGHIPGAGFVDLHGDLADPDDPNSIISPAVFSRLMGRLGVGPGTTVVLYDHRGGVWAARLWWALRYYGHDKVKMLNGGLSHWQAQGFPMETGEVELPAATFEAVPQARLRVEKSDVLAAIGNPQIRIVDALPEPFYLGEAGLYPGLRTGHIPGARNIPTEDNLDPQTLWVKPLSELQALWNSAAIEPDQAVITYCGGGVYAAFALFVLALMGHENSALYDASWREWGADHALPIESGKIA